MITFAGYVMGPLLFSLAVRLTGGWVVPSLLVAGQMAGMAAFGSWRLVRARR